MSGEVKDTTGIPAPIFNASFSTKMEVRKLHITLKTRTAPIAESFSLEHDAGEFNQHV